MPVAHDIYMEVIVALAVRQIRGDATLGYWINRMYKGWSLDCSIVGSFLVSWCCGVSHFASSIAIHSHLTDVSSFDIFLFSALNIVASLQALWECLKTCIILR